MDTYKDIIEVTETGNRGANILLKRGYKLLVIEIVAKAKKIRTEGSKPFVHVQRDIVYVLGRTEAIPQYKLTDEDFNS